MRQLQFFTTTQLATMRNRSGARNHSPAAEAFRRTHQRHRAWGLSQRHAERLRRMTNSPAAQRPGPAHDERPPATHEQDFVASSPAATSTTASSERTTTPAPPSTSLTRVEVRKATVVQPTHVLSPSAEVPPPAAGQSPVCEAPPSTRSDVSGKAPCTARATSGKPQHSGECPARPRRPPAAKSHRCASRDDRDPRPTNTLLRRGRAFTPTCRKGSLMPESRAPPRSHLRHLDKGAATTSCNRSP